MTNRSKRACAGALFLTILLAAPTANADLTTPGEFSLTVYDPSLNVVYQSEVAQSAVNPNTIYELYPETSVTVGVTSYLLPNISIFGSGALEFPNALPTALYAPGGNPITGPWDAIFGLVYDPNTQNWNGNSINYFLGFAAGPPGTGTTSAPDGSNTWYAEDTNPTGKGVGLYDATPYLNPSLAALGYTAYFYDPNFVPTPEPSSLTITLGVGGAMLAFGAVRRRSKSRAKSA
jgi:hypothetical protein